MNKSAKNVFIAAFAAVGLAVFVADSPAAGLAGINVQSALGQPLAAEIEIVALKPKEFEALQARIASPEAYKAANLVYVPVLTQLRVVPERREGGGAFLRLTSSAPVNEPSLNVLVEFTWPNGRLVQKYSILLDPAK